MAAYTLTTEQAAFAGEHIKLAYKLAHRFARNTGIPFDDLAGAAMEGLCRGAASFDPSLGWKPSTYLVPSIRGALLHFCRDRTYLLRIPHRTRELWMTGRKYIPRGLTDAAIADLCKVPLAVWLDCRSICSGPPVQLNEALHDAPSAGAHGAVEAVEDDGSAAYMEAAEIALEARAGAARSLYWSLRVADRSGRRGEIVETLLAAAAAALEGREIEEVLVPLAAASYGGEEVMELVLLPAEDLGGGRIQLSLLG